MQRGLAIALRFWASGGYRNLWSGQLDVIRHASLALPLEMCQMPEHARTLASLACPKSAKNLEAEAECSSGGFDSWKCVTRLQTCMAEEEQLPTSLNISFLIVCGVRGWVGSDDGEA